MVYISFGRLPAKAFFIGIVSMVSFVRLNFVCLFFVVLIGGCGSGSNFDGKVAEKNKSNIQKVCNALRLYQVRMGKPAPSEDELCEFIANNATIEKNLTKMKIDRSAFRDHLICERDSEPFFVRYGVEVKERGAVHPLVFESIGVDGVRQIGWSDSNVTEISDEKEYKKLKSGKYKEEKVIDHAAEATNQ